MQPSYLSQCSELQHTHAACIHFSSSQMLCSLITAKVDTILFTHSACTYIIHHNFCVHTLHSTCDLCTPIYLDLLPEQLPLHAITPPATTSTLCASYSTCTTTTFTLHRPLSLHLHYNLYPLYTCTTIYTPSHSTSTTTSTLHSNLHIPPALQPLHHQWYV